MTLSLRLPRHLKDQMQRASSSVVLNLAEGHAKSSIADQRRFFEIAFASLRESQAILDIASPASVGIVSEADKLAAHIFSVVAKIEIGTLTNSASFALQFRTLIQS